MVLLRVLVQRIGFYKFLYIHNSLLWFVQMCDAPLDMEGLRGVIVGVMEVGEEGAIVSLIGPVDRLLVARRVVELVSKRVWTLLERWDWAPSIG